MGTAKVASLSVRSQHAAHLCFEVDGILEVLRPQLGDKVPGFAFGSFYTLLGSAQTNPLDPSRLLYDWSEIWAHMEANFFLAALRAEPRKAALHKAINSRANAYFAKYASANQTAIISQMTDFFSPSKSGSKPIRLETLSNIAEKQRNRLAAAYASDETRRNSGVVKTTTSVLNSTTRSSGSSQETGQSNEVSIQGEDTGETLASIIPQGGAPLAGAGFAGELTNLQYQDGTSGESSQSQGLATESQTIVNTDYGYRVPDVESEAQYERAQISLIDQKFAQFMYGQNLPHLSDIFQNELDSINSDIYRLQIAFLNTILASPIKGWVTGIYKNPGDPVRAGEPVISVEDIESIQLVGTLIYPGPISIGSLVTVPTTTLFGSSGPPPMPSITGRIVAVRGQGQENRWAVTVNCTTPNVNSSGTPVLPLGYHFDQDDTTVSIT